MIRVFVALPDLLLQQKTLGTGEIVFRELSDFLEQLRTPLVVEIFRRKLLRHSRQTMPNVAEHLLARTMNGVWRGFADEVSGLLGLHASRAQRNPLKICRLIG